MEGSLHVENELDPFSRFDTIPARDRADMQLIPRVIKLTLATSMAVEAWKRVSTGQYDPRNVDRHVGSRVSAADTDGPHDGRLYAAWELY